METYLPIVLLTLAIVIAEHCRPGLLRLRQGALAAQLNAISYFAAGLAQGAVSFVEPRVTADKIWYGLFILIWFLLGVSVLALFQALRRVSGSAPPPGSSGSGS